MDGELVLEGLDSLWFFSNILFTPSSSPHFIDPPKPEQPLTSCTQPLSQQLVKSPKIEVEVPAGILSKESEEEKIRDQSKLIIRKTSSSEQSSTESLYSFHYKKDKEIREAEEMMFFISNGLLKHHQTCHSCKVPSMSHDVVMKEHLKSWAYAVACTVR